MLGFNQHRRDLWDRDQQSNTFKVVKKPRRQWARLDNKEI